MLVCDIVIAVVSLFFCGVTEMKDLEIAKIGDVILSCVPERYQHFFAKVNEDFIVENEWWSFGLELDDEQSIGTHVYALLPNTVELLCWMPDAKESFIELVWKEVAEQCFTWVYG